MQTVGFVKQDNQRDTISLLLSCFATLGLCVYSAVHLNIPPKGERPYRTLWREGKWCLVGLFAPELILYAAWRQLASAKQLQENIDGMSESTTRKTFIEKQANGSIGTISPHDGRATSWTTSHGFYGTMGGFAIDLEENENGSALFGGANRLTLTAKGVDLLARCGHLPHVSLDDIKDKNKADGLAKLLVCIQAGWMIVQVIARTATGLPITLLEVHTVAHVVCALLMYVIWWHKPRLVTSPTLLTGDWTRPLVAYMYLASRISSRRHPGILSRFMNPKPVLKHMLYIENGPSATGNINQASVIGPVGTNTIIRGNFVRPDSENFETESQVFQNFDPESEVHSTLLKLAAEAVTRYPVIRSRFSPLDEKTGNCFTPYSTELVVCHCIDWPNAGLLRRTQSLVMGSVLWGASTAYGAIHVGAWNYFFPTFAEKLIWNISSVYVTFAAAFWLLLNLLAHWLPLIDRVWVAYNERRLSWTLTALFSLLCVLNGILYIGSRTYLVAEAFASIREVPEDVYLTSGWSQVFPHL